MTLSPQRWQQVKAVLAAALEQPPGVRAAFLDRACARDASLRDEAESLLAHCDEAEGLLDGFADGAAGSRWSREESGMAGRRVGSYEIIRELGRGGMGTVWLARRSDEQFERQVAVKLIKRGMDTDLIVRRFRAERQILARLDHPNIARLLDGGTTENGLPFLIMEYVDGVPITRYADEHGLSTEARLKLFRQVCAAVHFAHQRLVIHRDLKPSNILVTSQGELKLMDFGVAKLLDPNSGPDADLTLTGQRPMTPAYASPEQARGAEVTTASDIYTLGVVLYELLTGQPPHQFTHELPHEVARVLSEREPALPSAVAGRLESPRFLIPLPWRANPVGNVRETRRRLRGDLDNIVLTAMRKEPARRYTSAAQLSADIGAFLDGLPVRARKDTLPYRTRKLIARNKVGTTAAVLVALALLGGTVATAWQARVAQRERARAERRFNDVRRMATAFLFELDDEIAREPTHARHLLVQRAREYLDGLAGEAGGDRTLQRELAEAYQKLGDVQSKLNDANIGDTSSALDSYQRALELRQALLSDPPRTPDNRAMLRRELAANYQRVGDMLSKTGHTAAALDDYRRCLPLLEPAGGDGGADAAAISQLADSRICVGRALIRVGDLAGAAEQYRQARAALDALPVPSSPDQQRAHQRERIRLVQSIGFLDSLEGRWPEALDNYRRNLAATRDWIRADHTDATAQRLLMDSQEWVAIALRECNDPADALDEHRQALALCQTAFALDPSNVQARNDLADVLHEIGNTLLVQGKAAEALASYRQAREYYAAVSAADPANVHVQRQVCLVTGEIADPLERQGDAAGACALRRSNLARLEKLAAADPANFEFQHDVALCLQELGEHPLERADPAKGGGDYLGRAGAMFEHLSVASPSNAGVRNELARLRSSNATGLLLPP